MRQKEYYTEEEIIENQYTTGQEYMTSDRIEYIGLYHKYLTGEIFTKGLYDPNKSIPLIPYAQESIDVQTFKKNKPKIKTNFQSPTQYYLIPNNEDIKNKQITRNILKNVSTNQLIEIDSKTLKQYQAKKIDNNLYQLETINWKISGVLNTTIVNGIIIEGVIEQNIKEIEIKSRKMPELLQYIKSYSEFYTDTTYIVPKNINQPDIVSNSLPNSTTSVTSTNSY
jgi:hypothetical protein